MTIRKSILMLGNTGTNWDLVGEPCLGNVHHGYTNGIHTVQFILQNFIGGVGIQGTLALNPKQEDWFWINLNPNGNSDQPYLTFPQNQYYPTGRSGGDTGSCVTTFIGNFAYLRAVITREHLSQYRPDQSQWQTWNWGQVDRVLLSM